MTDDERIAALREKLVAMRGELVRQLAFSIEGGTLALLAIAAGAITALDQYAAEDEAAARRRVA
jgi:hypothetical protein